MPELDPGPDLRLVPPDRAMSPLTTIFGCPENPLPGEGWELKAPEELTEWETEQLAYWLEPQATCTAIIRQSGGEALIALLLLAAKACKHRHVHMPPRVRSVAIFNGIEPL